MDEEYSISFTEDGGDFTLHDLTTEELIRLSHEVLYEIERRIEKAPP